MHTTRFDELAAGKTATLRDAVELMEAVREGRIHHEDGERWAAAWALMDECRTTYLGASITRDPLLHKRRSEYVIQRGDWFAEADNGAAALHEAERTFQAPNALSFYGWQMVEAEAAA